MSKTFFWVVVCVSFIALISCNSNERVEAYHPAAQTKDIVRSSVSDSIAIYEKTLQADSLNAGLRNKVAALYYASDQFDKGIYHFTRVCRSEPKNLTALTGLGNIYYDSKNYEQAVAYYEKALSVDKKNTNVRCDLATCYLNMDMPEKALKLLKENIAIDNNHIQSHHNLSVVYSKLGRQKEADEELAIYNKLSNK
jgi:tetratricopeptide (TPR) repeat protein